MTTPRLTSAVERLLRAMPRNPDIIELGEALNEARVDTTAVDATPAASPVETTGCPRCQKQRAAKRNAMRKYRTKP